MAESNGKEMRRVWLTTGTRVRHFTIEARIAASGIGEVYLAQDRNTKRRVALKILPAPPQCSTEQLEALAEQMNKQTMPRHSGICETYEVGVTENGKLFVSSEYVNGHSLDHLMMAKAKLDVEHIAEQLADALHAAHAAGRLHTDLKLTEIMVTPTGRVKILDFGLNRYKQLWLEGSDNGLPKTAVQPSSVRHFAPEHINGLPYSEQTDLFSLGTILYELLTGQAPFAGVTPLQVCAGIVWQKHLPILEILPEAAPAFCATIEKLLEKDLNQRTASARILLADLQQQLAARPQPVPQFAAKALQIRVTTQQIIFSDGSRMVVSFGKGFWQFLFHDGANYVVIGGATLIAIYALLTFLSLIGVLR